MAQRTRTRATLRQALSLAAVALALILSPGHGVLFAGGGTADEILMGMQHSIPSSTTVTRPAS